MKREENRKKKTQKTAFVAGRKARREGSFVAVASHSSSFIIQYVIYPLSLIESVGRVAIYKVTSSPDKAALDRTWKFDRLII